MFDGIRARLAPGSVAHRVAVLAGGTAAGQVIGLCALPIITRIYSPAEIGVIALFQSFLGFWASSLCLRYEDALLIAADDRESYLVQRLTVILLVFMSLLAVPLLWALRHYDLLGFGLLPGYSPAVAGLVALGYGGFMVYRSWALRGGLIGSIAKASMMRSAANAVVRIGLGLAGGGVLGLFAAEICGAFASLMGLLSATRRHFAGSRPGPGSAHRLPEIARKYMKFPLLDAPSSWIDLLAIALPVPLIAALYGPGPAGVFGLARMVVSAPNAQIGSAVADVFQAELARAVVGGSLRRARGLFHAILKRLCVWGGVPLLGSILLLPWGVPLIFGEEWSDAGYVAALIAPWMYANLVVGSLGRSLSVLQAQEYKLIYDISALVLLVGAYMVAERLDYTFLGFVALMSVSQMLGYLVYLSLIVFVMNRGFSQISGREDEGSRSCNL